LIGLGGVWAAVPDTEPALALGATLTMVAAGRAFEHSPPLRVDRISWIVLIVAAAGWGSAGWPQWVGGLACVGILGLPGPVRVVSTVVQLAVVVLASRWVTRYPVHLAIPIAVCVVAVGVVINRVAVGGRVRRIEF
jgi:hypothetical protein